MRASTDLTRIRAAACALGVLAGFARGDTCGPTLTAAHPRPLSTTGLLCAEEPPDVESLPRSDEGLPQRSSLQAAAAESLERGLAFLAAQQATQPDGSFPTGASDGYAPVAVTALSALALMAGGSSPDRGPHGEQVADAIDYLLARVDGSRGSETLGYLAAESDLVSRMHGHGYATLALAQAYAQSPRSKRGERIGTALEAAVRLIERSQGAEGGWYYSPSDRISHEGSVTITQVQALRAAHNAGIHVDTRVIAKAVRYVERSQNDDGMFRYALNRDETSISLTAAAVSTLNATGVYEGAYLQRGMDALWTRLLARGDAERAQLAKWPLYERLYVAQALWQHRDPRLFEQWHRDEVTRMVSRQRADGSWSGSPFGESYATAMNCLVLAMPQELLPIFQR